MKKLLIVGSGGHGRCCLDIARDLNRYDEISFLDDGHMNEVINDCNVIGTMSDMKKYFSHDVDIFVAIGNNQLRKQLFLEAKHIGYTIATLISPYAYVSSYSCIEEGTVVFPHVTIESNVHIGKGCIITSNATVNHDVNIDNYCLVYSQSVVRPNTLIKELSRIGSGCVIGFGTILEKESDIKDGEDVNV